MFIYLSSHHLFGFLSYLLNNELESNLGCKTVEVVLNQMISYQISGTTYLKAILKQVGLQKCLLI